MFPLVHILEIRERVTSSALLLPALARSGKLFRRSRLDVIERTQRLLLPPCVFLCRSRRVSHMSSTLAFRAARRPSRAAAAVDFNPAFLRLCRAWQPLEPPNPYSYPGEISMESYRKFTVAATRAASVSVRVKLVTSADHCRVRLAADSRMPTLDTGRRRRRRR